MDYVTRAFRDTRTSAMTLGLGTVIVTHSAMVMGYLPGSWGEAAKTNHAAINLAAAAAIAYGSGLMG